MDIKPLIHVSHNEKEFKKELMKIKEYCGRDIEKIREMINDVNTWCNGAIEMYSCHMANTYYLMHGDYFCMFILQLSLQEIIKNHEIHKLGIKKLAGISHFTEEEDHHLNEVFIDSVYSVFESGFGTYYTKDCGKAIDSDFLHTLNVILSSLNLSIIEKLTTKKPYVFFTEADTHTSLPHLNIIIFHTAAFYENDILDTKMLFLTVSNLLIEHTVQILFHEILIEENIEELKNMYHVKDMESLMINVGKDVAGYITEKHITDGLKMVRKFAKENTTEANILKNHFIRIIN